FGEPIRPGRKIGNSRKSGSLLFGEFIFFPKNWLTKTSRINVENLSSQHIKKTKATKPQPLYLYSSSNQFAPIK
ncbi:hypothetical protein, partial [Carnobacterium sp.]|uniref:hypothetical protein n=1 Tax=Carnobacterium sp. TaxID=48221 RepID=UPI002FC6A6CE